MLSFRHICLVSNDDTSALIITQAVRPGFKFRLGFFFFRFPRSVTNRRLVSKAHASPLLAYSTWNFQKLPSWRGSTDSLIFRAMKSHTNEHTVRGRPTLKDFLSVFATGRSASLTRDQFTSEHFEWIYQESCYTKGVINRGYQLFYLIKSIFRSVIVFLDVIENQVESQHELKNFWATRAERLENLFTNVSVRVHLSKTLWKTSYTVKYNKDKISN